MCKGNLKGKSPATVLCPCFSALQDLAVPISCENVSLENGNGVTQNTFMKHNILM